jgi:hypothetical protein
MTSSEILHNLPQIITAVAALITAITGLIKVMKDKGRTEPPQGATAPCIANRQRPDWRRSKKSDNAAYSRNSH